MGIWTNSDGLEVRFGLDRTTSINRGVTSAEEKIFVAYLDDATALADSDTAAVAGDEPFIPADAIIKDAYFVVDTQFTGTNAVLDIGLKTKAGATVDDDGIDAAIAVGTLVADAVVASDGGDIGTRTATDVYVTFTYDTAAFTAGSGKLVVKYILV